MLWFIILTLPGDPTQILMLAVHHGLLFHTTWWSYTQHHVCGMPWFFISTQPNVMLAAHHVILAVRRDIIVSTKNTQWSYM